MRIGLMSFLDAHHGQDPGERMRAGLSLAERIEALGWDSIWLTEHHGNPHNPTPRPELVLAHLAARTRRLELGSAALLLGYRSPLAVAEAIAVLAELAPGRLRIGLAKGGPFESLRQIDDLGGEARDRRFHRALGLLHRWLDGETVSDELDGHHWQQTALHPHTGHTGRVPLYLATRTPATIREAARHGDGLMTGQTGGDDPIDDLVLQYHAVAGHAPALMCSRGFWIDDNIDRARRRALAHIRAVRESKRDFKQRHGHVGGRRRGGGALTEETIDRVMLLGPLERIVERMRALGTRGVTDLALNPATLDDAARLEQVGRLTEGLADVRDHG
jgi:alkanesulfonate monooxygenase SsuD/methylene tetrahydromethanopterin reductase-like flavin-dependent oxidoreductase (luciferase family)